MSGSTNGPSAVDAPSAHTRLLDSLAGEVILRHVPGCRVLDLGYGSPEVTGWVQKHTVNRVCVVERDALEVPEDPTTGPTDAAKGMVAGAIPARLRLDELADDSFDLVYSLRTFPHLGHDADSSERLAREALQEAARVTIPGGTILVEIANPKSLRGVLDGVRHPITVVSQRGMVLESEFHLTRYDTLGRFKTFMPMNLDLVDLHGLGVLTPHASTQQIPLVGAVLARLEWLARDGRLLRYFGSHLLLVLRKLTRAELPLDLSTASLIAVQS